VARRRLLWGGVVLAWLMGRWVVGGGAVVVLVNGRQQRADVWSVNQSVVNCSAEGEARKEAALIGISSGSGSLFGGWGRWGACVCACAL